ncbi:MAG: leucyl/phenylalanyl-tRNA--protein transferase [Hyphomicrobiales bacterium]|nr:MAG: leucyl/phenylalanyl-tRNA--protein transferase [Hyphomicrobiales bacterium]
MTEQRAISRGRFTSFDKRPARGDERAALFRETPLELCERVTLGTAWALRPKRIGVLVPLARMWVAHLLGARATLPDADAVSGTCELAGIASDLSPPMLMEAYASGLFPHGHFGPVKWFSPLQRAVLHLDDFHISTRLRSIMRQGRYRVTFEGDFEGIIKGCAGRRSGRWHLTWITPRIMRAYAELYDAGHVHSFEVWNKDGELAGGGYGVAVGRVFVIESQFFRESNASKIGFSVLARHLANWGFVLADNKWLTPTTAQMGFHDIPRADYLSRLAVLTPEPVRTGRWEAELDSKAVADWRPAEDRAAR